MPTATPLVICASVHHGNTARVARCIADVLHADVRAPEAISVASLAEHAIVGFGSGVYYGRMHESLFALLGQLPDSPEPTRAAFVFSTSGLPFPRAVLARAAQTTARPQGLRRGRSIRLPRLRHLGAALAHRRPQPPASRRSGSGASERVRPAHRRGGWPGWPFTVISTYSESA